MAVMLPESGCCPAPGFAGSMQRSQELSPRSGEPAASVVLGDADAVLRTLKGLSAMTVKQESETDGEEMPSASAPPPPDSPSSVATTDLGVRSSSAPATPPSPSSPRTVLGKRSPTILDVEQLRQLQHHQQALHHQKQQIQLQQIHQQVQEQQQRPRSEQPRGGGPDTGRGRGRRRSRWKLKFHHQALPPEYLDHYEASLASQNNRGGPPTVNSKDNGDDKARVIGSRAPRNPDRKRPHPAESSRVSMTMPLIAPKPITPPNNPEVPVVTLDMGQTLTSSGATVPVPFSLEALARFQTLLGLGQQKTDIDPASFMVGNLINIMNKDDRVKATAPQHTPADPQRLSNKALLSNLLNNRAKLSQDHETEPKPTHHKALTYQDLPYMGEITLDNMKPRRGRKPKKADICHLIYKNYGTVFPKRDEEGSPPMTQDGDQLHGHRTQTLLARPATPILSRSDVQNRIISSLLEKRLTNNSIESKVINGSSRSSDEPLNLCLRDHNPLKIKLLRKHGNYYESNGNVSAGVKSEPASPEPESIVIEVDADPNLVPQEDDDEEDPEEVSPPSDDVLYWPGSNEMYVHPLLYSKGFPNVAGVTTSLSGLGNLSRLPHLQTMASLPPLPPLLRLSNTESSVAEDSPKSKSVVDSPTDRVRIQPTGNTSRKASARVQNTSHFAGTAPSPTKRKRSAIFIPPVPSESSSNPTTEVSICKFKFTGGAKPSLQEKKMLSVDAGGNFRYYSGTGDKSMRGYEFFPRESLQQHQLQQQSSQMALSKSAASSAAQSISASTSQPESLRSLLFQNVMDSIQMQNQNDVQLSFPPQQASTGSGQTAAGRSDFGDKLPLYPLKKTTHPSASNSRKRKTRKSLAREKLEKTFKEKGFLIQTQQLESAEGATYCKFRQLRKFTRYLFRSWKDYLPGNVGEVPGSSAVGANPAVPRTTPPGAGVAALGRLQGEDAVSVDALEPLQESTTC